MNFVVVVVVIVFREREWRKGRKRERERERERETILSRLHAQHRIGHGALSHDLSQNQESDA